MPRLPSGLLMLWSGPAPKPSTERENPPTRTFAITASNSSGVRGSDPRFGSALVVLVVAAPPDARLVAPLGGAVEPLVHPPEAVQSARIGGIGVIDDAVLEHERAHARPLARVRGRVGSGHGRVVADRRPRHAARHPLVAA